MTLKEKERILFNHGWEIECYSPFEIRNLNSDSFATGEAASLVLDSLIDREAEKNEDLKRIAMTINESPEVELDLGYLGNMSMLDLTTMFYDKFEEFDFI